MYIVVLMFVVHMYRGHQVASFYVKIALSPDDNFLLSGSSDNDAYIWPLNSNQTAPIKLIGSNKRNFYQYPAAE